MLFQALGTWSVFVLEDGLIQYIVPPSNTFYFELSSRL